MVSTVPWGMRLIARLVTALALVLTLSALPSRAEALVPAPAAQAAGGSDMKRGEYEQRLMYWVNRARDGHSKRSVKVRPCIDRFADRWARHLAVNEKFEHQSLGPIMRRCEVSSVGEIIAMGGVTPRQMVRMWLKSDGHRKILLSRHYRIAGAGAFLGDNGAWYGVIDFARR